MKSTIVSIMTAVAVLAAALVLGICIRELRFRAAQTERIEMPASTEADIEAEPVGPARTNRLAAEERSLRYEERASLSQQQRENLRSQRRGRSGTNSQEVKQRFAGMSQDEMAKLKEQWEKMSEQERQQFIAQMRERLNGRQRGERSDSADLTLQETAGSQGNVEETMGTDTSQENMQENSQNENVAQDEEATSQDNDEETEDEN